MQKIIVKYISTDYVEKNLDYILSCLDEDRIKKGKRYLNKNDQLLSFGAGYLIKKYIGKTEIFNSKNGKLYAKDGPFFNVSHSGNLAIIALSEDREIGVDIQLIKENDINPIQYVSEENYPINEMFQIWSNKESLIKCLGSNMSIIKEVPGLPLTGNREYLKEDFYTHSIIFEGYSISVTLKGKEPFEMVLEKVI